MQMTQNLGLLEELVPGSPGLGHLPRRMTPQDNTDGGITQRIQAAVQQGLISPQAGQYLMENLLQDDAQTAQALRGMPGGVMPPMNNVFPHSLLGD
jgi:hypothetical protein